MVTLVPGQHVQQYNGRVWRLVRPASPSTSGRRRWELSLVETPPNDVRPRGDVTYATENWLTENCVDVVTSIDPPMGNGTQVVRIVDGEGDILDFRQFQFAATAVTWMREQLLAGDDDWHGEWFGWDVESDAEPDLIAALKDGDLVWAEPLQRV